MRVRLTCTLDIDINMLTLDEVIEEYNKLHFKYGNDDYSLILEALKDDSCVSSIIDIEEL